MIGSANLKNIKLVLIKIILLICISSLILSSATVVKADEFFEGKTWEEIPLEDYSSATGEEADYLYELLMAVDVETLTAEQKASFVDKGQALMNAFYDSSTVNTIIGALSTAAGGALAGAFATMPPKARDLFIKIYPISDPIYYNPLFNTSAQTAGSVTPDTIISDAETFIDDGQNSSIATINQTNADIALKSIYNILLAIAITVTVVWGLVIAIKLMISSVEEKAEYKKLLWPYLIGCIVIFGSFVIWRIVIIVMNNVL